ncbi:iron complex outermembrane receptor protein [Paucibacter oligotrophus]|uniref:Iron complex outermembrane receptor protein n=1 Tax=Roseateles oligotrophus TaxID=1769250 RepID=A0A840LH97_9BURK|nr:TonB-dependent receptor [Roseateles oligotrophus]MBB4844647.1 iron complex outermembrane receptor protein [Roseateles oligotrophus]
MYHLLPSRPAPLALALLLAHALPQHAAHAQASEAATAAQAKTATLAPVLVTGSRISRLQAEGPSAVTILKSADLDRLGYRNVAEALAALTENSGFTQGEDYGNTWQPAANAISLRGLGPNRTLFLLNGRRIADYPTAYGGQVNFVDTSSIPSAMVERIDVLSGGASAIYGSDAIAGVVNVILKKNVQGHSLNLRAGGSQLGGGENARLQFVSGLNTQRLNAVFGLELSGREPIWDHQRKPFDDSTAFGADPTPVFGRRNASTQKWIAPPAEACQDLGGLFQGSVSAFTSKNGVYCGSGRARSSFWTNQTGKRSANASAVLSLDLSEGHSLVAEALLGQTQTFQNTRGPNWTSESRVGQKGYFRNANSGALETWSRRISPEEIGGAERYNRNWYDRSYNLALGARGEIGPNWNYEAAVNSSRYVSNTATPTFLAQADSFFLGERLGVDGKGVAQYAPDTQRLYRALTADEFNSFVGSSKRHNSSYSHNLTVQLNGELLPLPGGSLKSAFVAELGRQGYLNQADPRLGQNYFYSDTPTPDVGGDRKRAALGAELSAPLTRWLTSTAAARYDHYKFSQRSDSNTSVKLGLEARPSASLLLRGQYATSFRAPDLNYIYSEVSKGYYPASTDYYRCAQQGLEFDSKCEFADLAPGFNYASYASKNLKAEKGKSWNLGLVWAPSRELDLSLDFWKLAISDQIDDLSADQILRNESACRQGKKDIGSPLCVDALQRVKRNAPDAAVRPNAVTEIITNPVNIADTRTHGFDLSGSYNYRSERWGQLGLRAKFSRVLSYVYQANPGDPSINQIGSHDYEGWSNRLNASVNWKLGAWSHTLAAQRNGRVSSPSNDSDWFGPFWHFNLSTGVELSRATRIGLSINNLLGDIRYDRNTGARKTSYYLPYGRQAWLELTHRFGD